MKWLVRHLELYMDDLSIRKKFYMFYVLCVLIPLILTDSVVIYSVFHSEQVTRLHEMENTANAVQYSFQNSIERASEIGKSIYINKYIDEFLGKQFTDPLDYFNSYQNFFKDTFLYNIAGIDNIIITMYSDNETIVNGSEFNRIETIRDSAWYRYLKDSGRDKVLYFDYDKSKSPAVEAKRKILFLQKLDYYSATNQEKLLKVELDYSSMTRNLVKMNDNTTVYICCNNMILLSNGKYASVGKDFEPFLEQNKVGYSKELNLYGMNLKILAIKREVTVIEEIGKNLPVLLLLILINTLFPFIMIKGFNRSFMKRIGKLGEAFENVGQEHLVEIKEVQGKDEIGNLMRNYNKMAVRTNSLIQTVYKNRIMEQEMTVARQNAELLALHSQINPHFLFNALESIRMHSIIKHEMETADMVEKLAIMQRQYVEWGDDLIAIEKEMDFVNAYLGLQKYRFGNRLSYDIKVEEYCYRLEIPKLSVVTFVENACVHGIESKSSPGWIFVRIYVEEEWLCLEIEDTGKGLSESEIEELLYKMNHASIKMLKNKGRVGIVNACIRLKMMSNDAVCFELDGEEGNGIMVQIKIPLLYVSGNCKNI